MTNLWQAFPKFTITTDRVLSFSFNHGLDSRANDPKFGDGYSLCSKTKTWDPPHDIVSSSSEGELLDCLTILDLAAAIGGTQVPPKEFAHLLWKDLSTWAEYAKASLTILEESGHTRWADAIQWRGSITEYKFRSILGIETQFVVSYKDGVLARSWASLDTVRPGGHPHEIVSNVRAIADR